MKIRTYKYPTYFGLYQLIDIFIKDEDRAHKLASKIDDKFPKINDFFTWIYHKRARNDKIKIEHFDTWSADYTLAKIIVPVLEQLKEVKHGAPYTDNEDVPENLRSEDSENGDVCPTHFEKWDWVMTEMIYGFKFILDQEHSHPDNEQEWELHKKNSERAMNGRKLFAKYYEALWD